MGPTPYIHFRGDCAAAMAFYAEVFGAPAPTITTYAEAPAGAEVPGSDRVIHAVLTLGEGKLMASDVPAGMDGEPQAAVSVMYPVPDAETGRRICARLMAGGDEITAYGPTFFSQGFGMVRDRFGTHWMIAAPGGG